MKIWQTIKEQIAIVPVWGTGVAKGLRSSFKIIGTKFFGGTPQYEDTLINFNLARQLYSNTNTDFSLGAPFAKPIIDLPVDFIGLPTVTVEDEIEDDFLNECLHDYWAPQLQEVFRNSMRESVCIIRLQQDPLDNPLISEEERTHCRIETIPPERIEFSYRLGNKTVIDEARIRHTVMVIDDPGDPLLGERPIERQHEILEVVTPTDFQYYDVTDHKTLPSWNRPNPWGFVPIVEVFNEWDDTLNGGQSDLETVYPFIRAFHDVLSQGLQAHKYHSIPKVKFKLADVFTFIKNNFPDAIGDDGKIKSSGQVSWTGREAIFLETDENAEFLEARSVLGDTKTLLEFLIDCICVASETPRWAFMIVDTGVANQSDNAQTLPWLKKVERKRVRFTPYIQQLVKMVQVANGSKPQRAKVTWEIIRVQDQAAFNQALQQLIAGLEIAAQRGIISDSTYRELLRQFVPVMKNPTQEEKDAQKNLALPPPAPAGAGANGSGNPQNVPAPTPVAHGQQGRNE